jgi:hypothetical protein
MRLRLAVTVSLQGTLLLGFCIALTSCPSRPADTRPAIEFSKIPPAAQGGGKESILSRGTSKMPALGSRSLFMRAVGRGGCSPGPIAL